MQAAWVLWGFSIRFLGPLKPGAAGLVVEARRKRQAAQTGRKQRGTSPLLVAAKHLHVTLANDQSNQCYTR